jgi:uncharacterized protein (DUF4415 family)
MEVKHYTQAEVERLTSETDHGRLERMTDAEVEAAAESDPDNKPLTKAQLSAMRPISEVMPWLAKGRGRPAKEQPKVSITIRLDQRVIDHFKESGQGWQTRLNDVLMHYLEDNGRKAA